MFALASDAMSMVTQLINNLGYWGIFILTVIEGIGIPIPSEVVMPYGGFMASSHDILHVVYVAVIGTLGTGLGSSIGYFTGAWGGKQLVDKYGKYLGATPQKREKAERWFSKYGEAACLYTRLLPVVRSIVNVPAGLLKMDYKKFLAYTMVGAFPWCLTLAFAGYVLGENWQSIMVYSHELILAVAAILAIVTAAAAGIYILVKKGVIPQETLKKYLGFLTDI